MEVCVPFLELKVCVGEEFEELTLLLGSGVPF